METDKADPHDQPSWAVIVNPVSANGSTGRKWPRTEQMLRQQLPAFTAWHTERPRHAWELARQAVEQGYAVVAVHGGDGTVNEVVNGLLSHPDHDRAAVALLPHGTGADLVRTLGISHSVTKAADQATHAKTSRIDIGSIHFVDLDGEPSQRYFVDVADVGFGGELTHYVNNRSKWLGGRLSFLRGLLATLVRYQNKPIRVSIDSRSPFEVHASSIALANGQYFGGGMWVAPQARPDDGHLDVVIVGDVSRRDVLANIGRLYKGTLAEHPKVTAHVARTIALESDEEVLIEMDGELIGRLPARVEILPRKLSVLI